MELPPGGLRIAAPTLTPEQRRCTGCRAHSLRSGAGGELHRSGAALDDRGRLYRSIVQEARTPPDGVSTAPALRRRTGLAADDFQEFGGGDLPIIGRIVNGNDAFDLQL